MVHHGAQLLFVCFIQRRFNYSWRGTEKFNSRGALTLNITHPGTSLLTGKNRLIGVHAKAGIGNNTRRNDGVIGGPLLVPFNPIQTIETAGFAHRRDTVRQPELQHIFSGNTLGGAANMAMHINKARQDVFTTDIQLLVAWLRFRPALFNHRHPGVADTDHLDDTILFNNDINGPDRRCAFAVN